METQREQMLWKDDVDRLTWQRVATIRGFHCLQSVENTVFVTFNEAKPDKV